jgi:hypothetical protein
MTKPAVFISSSLEGLAAARELARQLENTAAVTFWSEGAYQAGKTVTESLTELADRSDFAIFLLRAQDAGTDQRLSTRSNMIFELGFLAGRLGLSRTFIILIDPVRIELPSDLAGVMCLAVSTSVSGIDSGISSAAAVIRRAMAHLGNRPDRRFAEYYSCFISYSWKDQDFAARLHDDLTNVGVDSWLDAKELKTGSPWRYQINKAMQAHDKVLLILSKASVQSAWVQLEVKNALRLERQRQQTILFPVRLDDSIFETPSIQVFEDLREKNIGDFRNWQIQSQYRRAFSHLVRDLTISASVEATGRQ